MARRPGSAARSNTKVSDGSSLMVRGNFSISASSEFWATRLRIVPTCPGKRIYQRRPVRRSAAGRRTDQEVAVAVDAAPLTRLTLGKPFQIVARDGLKTALLPAVERGHEMAGETFDDGVGVDHLETFAQQRNTRSGLHLLDMGHVGGAQDDAEHQPRRVLVLGAAGRPAQPCA